MEDGVNSSLSADPVEVPLQDSQEVEGAQDEEGTHHSLMPPGPDEAPEHDVEADTAIIAEFSRSLHLLSSLVQQCKDFVAADHNTYGNLEIFARCARNIAFAIVWTTLDPENAAILPVPLEDISHHSAGALEVFEYMNEKKSGFLYSARRQLGRLEPMMNALENILGDILNHLKDADQSAMGNAVRAAFPGVQGPAFVDLSADTGDEGGKLRLATLASDTALLAGALDQYLPQPPQPPQPQEKDQAPKPPPTPSVTITENPPTVQGGDKGKASGRGSLGLLQRLSAAGESAVGSVVSLTARSDGGAVYEDLFYPEVTIGNNCRDILRGCRELVAHDYDVYGNLELLARVVYNIAAPLLRVRLDELRGAEAGGMLNEPVASVLAYTTQAATQVKDMAKHKDSVFSFPRRNLSALETTFNKLEMLAENMQREYMGEGELEIRIGSARVRIIDLDAEPLQAEGSRARITRLVADMDVVYRVLVKRRRPSSPRRVSDAEEGEGDEEEESDEGEEEESDEEEEDGFVDVASLIRSEGGEFVTSFVDPFAGAEGDKWFFVNGPRLAAAVSYPMPHSLYVVLRCRHDCARFLAHHTDPIAASLNPPTSPHGDPAGLSPLEYHRMLADEMADLARPSRHVSTVVVSGGAGSGKTSLINAMLGTPILPVSVATVDRKRVPIVLTYGASLEISAVMRNGRAIRMGNEQELAVWMEEEEVLEDSGYGVPATVTHWGAVEIQVPHDLLRCGLVLVELPYGVDVPSLERKVRGLVTRAHAAIVVTDAGAVVWDGSLPADVRGKGLTEAALPRETVTVYRHFAQELSLPRVAVVVNKMDRIRKDKPRFRRAVNNAVGALYSSVVKEHSTPAQPVAQEVERLFAELFPGAQHGQHGSADLMPEEVIQGPHGGALGILGSLAFKAESLGEGDVIAAHNRMKRESVQGITQQHLAPQKTPQAVQVSYTCALWALTERTSGEGVEELRRSKQGRLYPAPTAVQHIERFHESGLGRLELWLARALLSGPFAAELVKEALERAEWNLALIALGNRMIARVMSHGTGPVLEDFENVRPNADVMYVGLDSVFSTIKGRAQVVRSHLAEMVGTEVDRIVREMSHRANSSILEQSFSANSSASHPIAVYESATGSLGAGIITDDLVRRPDVVKAYFLVQWRRLSGLVCAALCRAWAVSLKPFLGHAFALIEHEARAGIASVVQSETAFVSTLLGTSGSVPPLLQIPPELARTAGIDGQVRERMIAGVMDRLEDAGHDLWDKFVIDTDFVSGGGSIGNILPSMLKGALETKGASMEVKVALWARDRMPRWLSANRTRVSNVVTDALVGSMQERALRLHERLTCALHCLEGDVEGALGVLPEAEGGKGTADVRMEGSAAVAAAVGSVAQLKERAAWVLVYDPESNPVPPTFEPEAPSPTDMPCNEPLPDVGDLPVFISVEEVEAATRDATRDTNEPYTPSRPVPYASAPTPSGHVTPSALPGARGEGGDEDYVLYESPAGRRPVSGYFVTLPITTKLGAGLSPRSEGVESDRGDEA